MPPIPKKAMMKLGQKLKQSGAKDPRRGPLWEGPSSPGPQGGITQSLLSTFLVCRERFRIKVVDGLREEEGFNVRLEYGNMWHKCEECLADLTNRNWGEELRAYAQDLCRKYRHQQDEINKWYNICLLQFPIYVDFWKKHPDVKNRKPLLQEGEFKVPYLLPSGRYAWARGKFDSVDLIGKGKEARVWLQENKTKSELKEDQIKRQLKFDLQTMTYLSALRRLQELIAGKGPDVDTSEAILPAAEFMGQLNGIEQPIGGVRYNCVRRPLAGGKGTIVRHKPTKSNPDGESEAEYYDRLKGVILEDKESYFLRFTVPVSTAEILDFEQHCLTPALENLCDWWEWIKSTDDPFAQMGVTPAGREISNRFHWRTPYNLYNPMAEGRTGDIDAYLDEGSLVGLSRSETLFPELG